MELTVQNVYGLLLRSRLLSLEEARTMFARWQEEAKEQSTNLAKFASWMVANRYVTEYQAGLLARGHADGFFLGDYKVLDRLGKGRMAGVYRARHKLGQMVAIKVLPPSKAREPTLLARFQRESKLALLLRHPNIVRSFQMGVAGGLHYLVMEHLEGETLEEVLARRKQLPAPEAVRLVYQALQGLQHIHEQGLVHRDLKPSNLMLVPPPAADTSLCTVKILDIGLGRVLWEEGPEPQEQGLTTEGVLLGTPDYMAPEQARDPRTTDIRADVYSLGCVLYHLLAGQPPFPDTNIISQMIKHATEQARPLRDFNPAIPDSLQQIVNWMMAKAAASRYPTPARAAAALEVFLAAGSVAASSPDLDPDMKPYLSWLEAQGPGSPVTTTPVGNMPMVAAVPGKPPSGTPIAAVLAEPSARAEDSDPGRKKKDRRAAKKDPPPRIPAEEGSFDVELVPLPATARAAPTAGRLTRRDFLMFFAGVGSVTVAYLVGRGLAALFGRWRDRHKDNDKDKE
jgi:serine/threonine protein kinase